MRSIFYSAIVAVAHLAGQTQATPISATYNEQLSQLDAELAWSNECTRLIGVLDNKYGLNTRLTVGDDGPLSIEKMNGMAWKS